MYRELAFSIMLTFLYCNMIFMSFDLAKPASIVYDCALALYLCSAIPSPLNRIIKCAGIVDF